MSVLRDHVVIITGASGGIGAATAEVLSEAGMACVLAARNRAKLEALAARLPRAVACPGDMTDPAMPERLVTAALEGFGRLDVVFNNAGVMHIGSVDEVDIEAVCRMVRLNVEALVRMSYVALRHLKAQGRGFLVNTSSFAGLKTFRHIGAYNGTKFAVEAFTDALRMELAGSGVRVACIQPGRTQTGLFDHWRPDQKFAPGEGMIDPRHVAQAVRYILAQPPEVLIPRLLVMPASQPT